MSEETVDNSTETSAADAVAEMAGAETTTTEIAAKPEGVPDKFYNAETGEVRHDDILNSYNELSSKFGSFTGSPEEFTHSLSEELTEQGVELLDDDPMLESAKEFAKDMNMNQEGFDKMVNMYGMLKLAETNAQGEATAADIASLGDNADRRINNMSQWASKNLPEDMIEGFKDMAVSADSVKAMEQIISMTRNAPVQVNEAQASASVNEQEVNEMQFAKDENGNRKIHTNKAFKAEYDAKRKLLYGEEEFREVVGG